MFCYTLKSITVDQIEKEREKEGEFWATQPKEVCIKKQMMMQSMRRNMQKKMVLGLWELVQIGQKF